MELLPKKTYKILKDFKNGDVLFETIAKKHGKSAEERVLQLVRLHYIRLVSETDGWGGAVEPKKYGITELGQIYLEDYSSYVARETMQALGKSVFIPILVTAAANLIISGIKLWLQLP